MFSNTNFKFNGDVVVGFTSTAKLKNGAVADLPSVSSWYSEDPNANHLGLIDLTSNWTEEFMPTYRRFFENKQILEVNGANGTFRYDIKLKSDYDLKTVGDTSDYSERPGIGGSPFPIILSEYVAPGTVLTYDVDEGAQVVVAEDFVAEEVLDGYKVWVYLVSNSKDDYFPPDKLKPNVSYVAIGHGMNENSTQFATISNGAGFKVLTNEFHLGNHRGVEAYVSMYAGMKDFSGASIQTREYIDYIQRKVESLGEDETGNLRNVFITGERTKSGKIKINNIATAYEFFVWAELMKLEAYQLMWQRGGVVNTSHGAIRLNEGLWHQYKRGYTIKYPRIGGLTRDVFRRASAYIFRGRNIEPTRRVLRFEGGMGAVNQLLELFRDEVTTQLNQLSLVLGKDRVLPKSPVEGTDLLSLTLLPVQFRSVFIPGVGTLEINYNPEFDYTPLTDKKSQGFYNGLPKRSYSFAMFDITSPEYTNVELSPNVKPVNRTVFEKSNVFYVKPKGRNFWWGYRNGRWSRDGGDVIASAGKNLGYEIWGHSISAGWVKDLSRVLLIELA